ncbi:uroporphyrinogen-III synthase [Acinetobacter calcoaceticus]|uniref:Uroporphyrinogen-III synthase n=1 Tax=Acinetobacter calcoaceticus TaxID=471 RepID=A0A4R1Y7E1_ACICA|nr:uroporphyrinogen-III synthase [Acinetobacter calcoaceticus]
MLFINTRPTERASALTQHLSLAGFEVVDLPLLALRPMELSEQLQLQFQQLFDVQVIVVVSPTAVEIGLKYLTQSAIQLSQLAHVQWVAVGKTTAAALADHGIQALIPEVETSEGMLHLPIFSQRDDLEKVAFWRGEGGRQFMMQQCLAQQIKVLNFVLYQRYCPEASFDQFIDLLRIAKAKYPHFWMCVSSEASWKHWLILCKQQKSFLEQGHYLVLGERLYQILRADQKSNDLQLNVSLLENLGVNTVLQTIQRLQRSL